VHSWWCSKIRKLISKEIIKRNAIEIFEVKGVANTSVNDIVKLSEIAKGTFYLYYKDKDELINDVFDAYNESFKNEVVLKNSENPKIKKFSKSVLDYFSGSKMFLIELRNNISGEKKYSYISKTVENFTHVILNFLNLSAENGIIRVDIYAKMILGMIIELCYHAIIEKNIGSIEEASVLLEDVMARFFKCE
jgi:AcrR family transcriptional regulator